MNRTILEVQNVSFRHRLSMDAYSEAVLKGISFKVGEGEILVLIGPSGAGKTTLLRLLNRLEDPEAGTIRYDKADIRSFSPQDLRKQIALVSQEPFLIEGTVRDNVFLPLTILKEASGLKSTVQSVLASVGLPGELLDRSAHHLSMGEKQRICIARTLMVSPKVILMDEPTSALDPDNRTVLSQTIARINKTENITFIVVTHLQDFAESLGGRILFMKNGEVISP